jgi:outer membrane murein-binding lipoprotein Lpp
VTTPEVKPDFVARPELLEVLQSFRKELAELTKRKERERSEVERLNGRVKELAGIIDKKEEENKLLRTAREAAKMVDDRQNPPPVIVGAVSQQEYDRLNRDFEELSRKFEELKNQIPTKVTTPFWIDEYGTIHSDLPWLVRLIDLNRTTAVIVKHLMENGKASAEDLALKYGFHVTTMRERLNLLVKKGVVCYTETRPHRYYLRGA